MTSLSLLCVAFALSTLGAFIFRARPGNPINRALAIMTFVATGWTLGVAASYTGYYLDVFARLTFAFASLIPGAFLVFTRHYPMLTAWPSRHIVNAALALGAMWSVISITTP